MYEQAIPSAGRISELTVETQARGVKEGEAAEIFVRPWLVSTIDSSCLLGLHPAMF